MINVLTKRIIEIHESSAENIAGIHRINVTSSALSKALVNMHIHSNGVVKAMIKTMAIFGKTVQSLHITRLVNGLVFVFETDSSEFKSAVSNLVSFKVSISWRFTGIIPRIIKRHLGELRELYLPPSKRAATIPLIPLAIHSPTVETMGAIADNISKISEVGQRIYKTATAVTTRAGLRLVTEEAAKSHEMETTSISPSQIEVLEKRALEHARSHVRMAARYAPLIIDVKTLGYRLGRRADDVHKARQELVKVYREGATIMRTPLIQEKAKVSSDYVKRISSMAMREAASFSRSIKPVRAARARAGNMKIPILGVVEALRACPSADAMETVKILSGIVSIEGGRFPSGMKEKYLRLLVETSLLSKYLVTGTKPRMFSEMSRSLKLIMDEVKELSMSCPVEVPTPLFVNIMKAASGYAAALETSRAINKFCVVLRPVMTYKAEIEKTIERSLGGPMDTQSHISLEGFALGRVLLGGPPSIPTVRLHEIIPILHAASTQAGSERPIRNVFNITIDDRSINRRFESLSGEVDLKELERKISRILREEARRYGIIP